MDKNIKIDIENNEILYKIIIALIIIFGITIRAINITEIPIGLHADEAGTFYDAYCIANYGTDRYLNPNPFYGINYGGGQSTLYMYLTALFIKIIGFKILAVKLPSLILSSISIIVFYKILDKFENKKMAIIGTLLIAIVPWHFMQSRWGLDCNLMSSMILISTYALLCAKKPLGYIVSGILFGITLYTYILSYIIVPIILFLTMIYLLYIKKIKIRNIIQMGIPLGLLAIPLILNLMVNNGILPEIRTDMFSMPRLFIYGNRASEISLYNIPENIFIIFIRMFAADPCNYNSFIEFGTLYYISIPFAIIGIIKILENFKTNLKSKKINLDIVFLILCASSFVFDIFVHGIWVNTINGIYIPLIYIIAKGIYELVTKHRKMGIVIFSAYFLLFIIFMAYYFGYYGSVNTDVGFNKSTIEVVKYIEENNKFDGKKINIKTGAVQPHIYTLIGNKTNPKEFMKDKVMSGTIVFSYGRYIFYNSNIDQETIYVINKSYKDKKEKLLQKGFKFEEFEDLYIFYYE